MGLLTDKQIRKMGFKGTYRNARISDKASFYGAHNVIINDDVRIDDFAVISAGEGRIYIGSHVHIAVFVSLIGSATIVLRDYSGLSGRVSVYSATDDFSGAAMTGPTVPAEFTNVKAAPVVVGFHVVVGSGTVILPGSNLQDGSAVGAMSLVKGELEPWTLYAGIPAKPVRERSRELLAMQREYEKRRGIVRI